MVKSGDMVGTVAQYPKVMSSTALDAAIDTLNGKPVENPIYTRVEVLTKKDL